MKKPTDEQLLEICKKYRCEDNSDPKNIQIEKQLGDFRLVIFIEFDDENEFYNAQICLRYENHDDLDIDEYDSVSIDDYEFDQFIEHQIQEAKNIVSEYEKLPGMIKKIEHFINEKNLDFEFAKTLIIGEVEGW